MRAYFPSSEGVASERLEIRAQRTAAIEVEIVIRPTRCSPVPTQIAPRHPIAVGPALDPDPRAFWDGATLSSLVHARDPTTYDGHRLHRMRLWAGEPQAGFSPRQYRSQCILGAG